MANQHQDQQQEAPPAEPRKPLPQVCYDPRNATEASMLAAWLSKSTLLAPDLKHNQPNIFATILAGHELHLPPMQALRGIRIVKGNIIIAADLMVAQCKRKSEICEYFRLVTSTDTEATYETKRAGEPEATRLTWTHEMAEKAGLLDKVTWVAHEPAMLRARASSALARVVYPDLVHGIYTPDEADEFQPEPQPDWATPTPSGPGSIPVAAADPLPTAPLSTTEMQAERLMTKTPGAQALVGQSFNLQTQDGPTKDGGIPEPEGMVTPEEREKKVAEAKAKIDKNLDTIDGPDAVKDFIRKQAGALAEEAVDREAAKDESPEPGDKGSTQMPFCGECGGGPGDCDPDCSLQGGEGPPEETDTDDHEADIPLVDDAP